ncbi:helix-turn-helix transcriptional regulator [Streptomyces sp. WMMB 322]|uniref:ArsR/SmtB family transcription factor n=1 Tax=Streptomyces sp. WMMB 322 TaxID=1286821 RepID=UPI0006E350E7|nr:winged helix-turn-helix domain-containing protein [Streptomyces sp. WMMB 322]SCK48911.1 transcriptional regulator, ArsR family [Streptomyces sp. WMMB 322]
MEPDAGPSRPDRSGQRLAGLAGLLADPTRASVCLALQDGRAWTAGELARAAGVTAATVSAHLDKLVAGGLLEEVRQGRHRYVRIAGAGISQLIEDLTAHAGPPPAPRGLSAASAGAAMARARTCYDHLAGALGVAVTDALLARGLLQQSTGFSVTDEGLEWFGKLGIDLAPRRSSRRPATAQGAARSCLDWTERRPHLAGRAGAALCSRALEEGWCERIGSRRALRVTRKGQDAFEDLLGLRVEEIGVRVEAAA